MISSLTLSPFWRDTWGNFDAAIFPTLQPLDHNTCYLPKYYCAPSIDQQLILPGKNVRYTMSITPGSLIWGFWCPFTTPLFSVQITDVTTGHTFSDQPLANIFYSNPSTGQPNLLETPYPVIGEGKFRVEIWANPATGTNDAAVRCYLIFAVAEVVCPQ